MLSIHKMRSLDPSDSINKLSFAISSRTIYYSLCIKFGFTIFKVNHLFSLTSLCVSLIVRITDAFSMHHICVYWLRVCYCVCAATDWITCRYAIENVPQFQFVTFTLFYLLFEFQFILALSLSSVLSIFLSAANARRPVMLNNEKRNSVSR